MRYVLPLFCIGFFAIPVGTGILGYRKSQKRKMKYLPAQDYPSKAMASKEVWTAIEVAILMEQPADKIFTMILFSVIKKGAAASVISQDPLKLEFHEVDPESLRTYEKEFLDSFKKKTKDQQKKAMPRCSCQVDQICCREDERFSAIKRTVAYYKDIMLKAWKQVQDAETPDVKMQKFDDNMDWTMLDRDFDERMEDVFRTGPVFVPVWWGHFDPTFRTSTPSNIPTTSRSGSGGGGTPISMPNLPGSAFAASMINRCTKLLFRCNR